jgi:hypothetical protein
MLMSGLCVKTIPANTLVRITQTTNGSELIDQSKSEKPAILLVALSILSTLLLVGCMGLPEVFGAQATRQHSESLAGYVRDSCAKRCHRFYASHHDVSVWVLGVVMLHRNPFQVGPEVALHTFHQFAR